MTSLRSLRRRLLPESAWFRTMTLGVQAVVIDEHGRVFLVRHSYVPGWHLPGGGVEVGESLLKALTRELAEECNIALIEPPVLHGVFLNSRISDRDHVFVYVVRGFQQKGPPQPNYEIIDHGSFDPDVLPSDTSPAARRRISEVLEGTPIDQYW
jgi:ADP-ribose pyrophosphatase YjhB (NUDIX family)